MRCPVVAHHTPDTSGVLIAIQTKPRFGEKTKMVEQFAMLAKYTSVSMAGSDHRQCEAQQLRSDRADNRVHPQDPIRFPDTSYISTVLTTTLSLLIVPTKPTQLRRSTTYCDPKDCPCPTHNPPRHPPTNTWGTHQGLPDLALRIPMKDDVRHRLRPASLYSSNSNICG